MRDHDRTITFCQPPTHHQVAAVPGGTGPKGPARGHAEGTVPGLPRTEKERERERLVSAKAVAVFFDNVDPPVLCDDEAEPGRAIVLWRYIPPARRRERRGCGGRKTSLQSHSPDIKTIMLSTHQVRFNNNDLLP